MVFFISWQLWEQLTFVLAMSLVGVFIGGYVKLWWITRKVRKHELDDVEKRMKEQEMRGNGQVVETTEEFDIPFGVRALEKGVEVEGIWMCSNKATVPEHQRIGRYIKRKSDASEMSRPRSAVSSIAKGGRRAFSAFGMSSTSDIAPADAQASDAEIQSGNESAETSSRRTYKPKLSSQLRYSSYNETQYDPATLGQLEGDIAIKDGVQVRRPRGAGPIPGTAENMSSVSLAENADNERSSGSDESSIGTFANNALAEASQTPSSYVSARTQKHGGYFAVPTPGTPANSAENPFATPSQTPAASDTSSKYMATPGYDVGAESSAGESGLPLLCSKAQSESPERHNATLETGFQRANQTTRHVNTGFSVLPAGTFPTTKGKEVERPTSQDSVASQNIESRKPNKLQKKGRSSMTGPRRSDDLR